MASLKHSYRYIDNEIEFGHVFGADRVVRKYFADKYNMVPEYLIRIARKCATVVYQTTHIFAANTGTMVADHTVTCRECALPLPSPHRYSDLLSFFYAQCCAGKSSQPRS